VVDGLFGTMYFNLSQAIHCFRFAIIDSIDEQAAAMKAFYGTWSFAIYKSSGGLDRTAVAR